MKHGYRRLKPLLVAGSIATLGISGCACYPYPVGYAGYRGGYGGYTISLQYGYGYPGYRYKYPGYRYKYPGYGFGYGFKGHHGHRYRGGGGYGLRFGWHDGRRYPR